MDSQNYSLEKQRRAGGINVKSTKNLQFELIHPNVQVFTPSESTINANVRTISATSIGGYQNGIPESSFEDKGFEPVVLNENNYFDTPRMVASRVNELQFVSDTSWIKIFDFGVKFEFSS